MAGTKKTIRMELPGSTILRCHECGSETLHSDLVRVDSSWEAGEGAIWGSDEHAVVECQGCGSLSFCHRSRFSEDEVIGDHGPVPRVHVHQYPGPKKERVELDAIDLIPDGVKRIYRETLQALEGGSPVLAAVGVRVIVEAVCKEREAGGGTLQKRIDSLRDQGLVTESGARILHGVRTLGNEAAHEVKEHTPAELNAALDVVEYILSGVYIIPSKASVFDTGDRTFP